MVYSSNKNGDGIGMVYGIGFTTCIPKKIEKVKLITILGLDVPFLSSWGVLFTYNLGDFLLVGLCFLVPQKRSKPQGRLDEFDLSKSFDDHENLLAAGGMLDEIQAGSTSSAGFHQVHCWDQGAGSVSENNFPIGNPPFKRIREYWGIYRESIFSQILEKTFFSVFGPLDPQQNPQKIQERVHAFLGETLSHRARGQPKTMLDAKESREFLFYTSLNPERLTAMNKESGLQNL